MSKKMKGAALAQSTPSTPSASPENDYETQGHLEAIIKAHGIINDPEKMLKVHALAGRHHKAIKSIKDIKNAYHEKFGAGALKDAAEPDADDK